MDKPIDFSRLAPSEPPADLWPAIADELDRHRRRRLVVRVSALAAMISVVVLAAVFIDMFEPGPAPVPATNNRADVTLAELRATSARLESRLAGQRHRVVEGGELESLLWLETELAWLDEQLADSPHDRELWRQRVGLLSELNRRYAGSDWRRSLLLASV